jgi:hypothetical protein
MIISCNHLQVPCKDLLQVRRQAGKEALKSVEFALKSLQKTIEIADEKIEKLAASATRLDHYFGTGTFLPVSVPLHTGKAIRNVLPGEPEIIIDIDGRFYLAISLDN